MMTVTIGPEAPPRWPEGSKCARIWSALRADAWMPKAVLAEQCGMELGNLSPALTDMRRTGWIEYRHTGGRLYEWRRRIVWAEPQPDIVNRTKNPRGQNVTHHTEPTITEHLEQARYHIEKAMEAVADIEAVQQALAKIRRDTRELF